MAEPVTLPGEEFGPGGQLLRAPTIDRVDLVPVEHPIPDVNALRNLSVKQRLEVAQRYDLYPGAKEYQDDVAQYVARFSRAPSTLANQPAEVARLTDPMQSNRASLGLARRAQRQYNERAAVNGDPEQQMIWLVEDDGSSCAGCLKYNGAEGTAEELKEMSGGGRGHQECGENCRCDWLPIIDVFDDGATKPVNWLTTGRAAQQILEAVLGAA